MAEALEQVKHQFGRGAVILNTRTLSKGRLLGLSSKQCVEITAARTLADLPEPLRRSSLAYRSRSTGDMEAAAKPSSHPAPTDHLSHQTLLAEIGTVKSLVGDLVRQQRRAQAASVPDELYETYLRLTQNDVAEELAQQLVERVRAALDARKLGDPSAVRAQLAKALEAMLPTAGAIRAAPLGEPTVIALVGPTGVGKTTTIAKLAANFCLREQKKVGLITIDTYRIAAVDQLKTYAQIIELPLEVVVSPEQLKEAVARMADRDIVLIDTAGRSQRDAIKIKELRGFFQTVRPHELHLVLSSTCGRAVLMETIRRFSEVGIDRVIFTKLDEAVGFGVVLSCLHLANARLSYVTTGQDVPDDISVGEGRALAMLILEEGSAPSLCR